MALLAAAPQPATAAPPLRTSEPADGARVAAVPDFLRLSFTAPVEQEAFWDARFAGLGDRAMRLPVIPAPDDPQAVLIRLPGLVPAGAYRLSWRVFMADGSPASGTWSVRVGAGTGAVPAPPGDMVRPAGVWVAGVGRLLLITGLVTALGLVAFRWTVVSPAWTQGGLVAPGRADDPEGFRARVAVGLEQALPAWWSAWSAAVAAWLAGAALVVAGTLVAVRAGGAGVGDLFTGTRLGSAMLPVGAAAVLAAAVGLLVRRGGRAPAPASVLGVALAAPAAAALVAVSWLGHASSGNDVTLNVAADAVHGLATALWLGGLVGFAVLLLPALGGVPDNDRVRMLAPAVVRFSALAFGCVAVLVVTGVYRALAELAALGDLVHTGYGRALAVKLALFALMLGVGAYNRFRVHPRLERAAVDLPGGDATAAQRLRTSIRVELLLAAGVLVAVAVLVSTAPTA